LGYEYFFASTIAAGTEGQKMVWGNGIFSRLPILGKKTVYVQKEDPNNESFETEDRMYVELEVDVHGKKLKIGTVHLSYSDTFKMNSERLREASELYKAVEEHHERFILAGDLNTTPDSPIIKHLEEIFIHADPDVNRPTWTTKPFSYRGFEANKLDWRLDYIFATEDINIISNKFIKTNYSDHLPILTEIQI
jgi:endonuclease/exonuclease/phosphatase family metal-dependent hydrolase